MKDDTLEKIKESVPNRLNIGIHYDSDASNPLEEWDGQWTLIPLKRDGLRTKHECRGAKDAESVFYVETVNWNKVPNMGLRRKLQVGLAFTLSHQPYNGTWTVEEFDKRVDTEELCESDGLLLWEHPISDMGAKTYEDRLSDAKSDMETYNAYLTGDVYGYTVEVEGGEHLDSCWGFYGPDPGYMFDEVRSAVRSYMEKGYFERCEVITEEDYLCEEEPFEDGTLYLVLEGDAKDMAEWKYSVVPEAGEEKKAA